MGDWGPDERALGVLGTPDIELLHTVCGLGLLSLWFHDKYLDYHFDGLKL